MASASRVAIGDSAVGAGRVAAEMNPLAVKQAIRAGAEDGSGCECDKWSLGPQPPRRQADTTVGGMGLRQTLEVSVKELGCESLFIISAGVSADIHSCDTSFTSSS